MFKLSGVSMNDHFLQGSDQVKQAFVDSGTTFSYLPRRIWDSLMFHFDYFCEHTKNIKDSNGNKMYCPGERFLTSSQNEEVVCFNYDQQLYENGGLNTTKDFLMSYPVIRFHAKDVKGKDSVIEWFPSEYLYREPSGKMYCLAADKNNDPNQILFGSTLMRQHQYIFDIQNERIGVSRTSCSKDNNMILSEADFIASGRTFGFKSVQ